MSQNSTSWDRIARRIESDAIEDLRGHKRLQSPAGQSFVRGLQGLHSEKTAPLMPWLAREFRKQRLRHDWLEDRLQRHPVGRALPDDVKAALREYHLKGVNPGYASGADVAGLHNSLFTDHPAPLSYDAGDANHALDRRTVNHWSDLLQSEHPLRVAPEDLNHYDLPAFHQRVQDWDQAMTEAAEHAKLEALQGGKVVHSYPDKWTVRQLSTPEELQAEGDAMGHCVGGAGYDHAVANGNSLIYSLRDPQGRPHVTTEMTPTKYQWTDSFGRPQRTDQKHYVNNELSTQPIPQNGEIVQIQGKSNEPPIPEYQARMKDWFATFPEEERPRWGEGNVPDNARALLDPEGGEYGGYGPHGDYGVAGPVPDYPSILNSLIEGRGGYRNPQYEFDQGEGVYQYALKNRQIPQFGSALENFAQEQQDNFDDWRDQNYEHAVPYPAEAEEDSPEMQAYYEDEKNWMDEHAGMQATNHLYGLLNQHAFTEGGYQNELSQPQQQTLAKTANALYTRWVFSPASGDVRIEDNSGHPLDVKYHTDLARELNEPNLVHGYAYRIANGWRLTDWDSKPVEDPFVVASVMRALQGSEPPRGPEDAPEGQDWTRVHHGLPS